MEPQHLLPIPQPLPIIFHMLHAGIIGMSCGHQLVKVTLVRRGGALTLTGYYLVGMLHAAVECSTGTHLVNARPFIP